ncbi:MAG: MipA/OmpV family protein [Woeseiaceae bacterium]
MQRSSHWTQGNDARAFQVMRHIVVVALASLIPGYASAGSLLDYIRNYDLNDYALGVGISAEQNPYTGAENSAYAYPYLTSFRHSSMTDDWILIRDGGLGFRWVNDTGWEIGAIGRVQTLGLGNVETDDLLGISDREWALEVGPTIGWRGWPVHVNWTTYYEVTDRHHGLVSQLAFLLPMEWSRGYFVPSIELIQQSSDYNDYYFSVTPAESTPLRPAYRASSSISSAVKFRWGYALGDKWLLTGKIGYEDLGSEITASPIVDRDNTWSTSIALAYNADVFRPRAYDGSSPNSPRFDLRIGGFYDQIDTKVKRDTMDGVPGFETDIEEFLGAADEEAVLQVDASLRIGEYHRLEFGYFELGRNSATTLTQDLSFGDELFAAGTEVDVVADAKVFRAGYAYSLIRNAQLELGIMAGVHVIDFDAEIVADSTNQVAGSSTATPLPVVGAHASVFLGEKTTLGAKLQLFRTDFDRFEGSLNYATLDLLRRLGDKVSVGIGYNFYEMNLTSTNNELNGDLRVRHHGPVAFFTVGL